MNDDARRTPHDAAQGSEPAAGKPVYEPPRIVKKRSVSRATLFTGGGPSAGGLVGPPPSH